MHNVTTVIGIDEVGRGAWAGPLVVGAVLLEEPIDGLRDSKLISKKEREQLEQTIRSESSFVGLGWVLPKEVDDLGLTKALQLGCVRALSNAPSNKNIIMMGVSISFLIFQTAKT
jgi:ribonuclease HII